jgi:TonB-linked SusC/RagA family outer membrane protein
MKFTKSLIFCFLTILISVSAWSQDITVAGKVLDEKGLPIPGANILIKGSTRAVATDFDGNYQIKTASNGTLVISFIGYKTVEQSIKGRIQINVTMNPSAEALQEVVVTALGIKRETKALGYSVQKVSGESLQKVSGVDVASSLTGKVAGLLVKNSTDFGTAPAITIRGEKPLLVVDGIAYANKTLSDISSEDIETITVLKGATASALYGFRGASGAILVTTKNGTTFKSGITVDFATNTMFTAGFLAIPEKQSVYGRGGANFYMPASDQSWGERMDGQILNQWDPYLKDYRDYEYLPVGKDNFENFLEQGYITNNNFNIGYKGEIVSLRSSLNWIQNKGQYPNAKQDKYTYTFGGDINLNKFKLSSNISYAKKVVPNLGMNGYTAYDPMYTLLVWSSADFNVLDYKDYWIIKDQVQNFTYKADENNPYYDRYEKTNEVHRDIFNADLTMSYQFTDWLKATLRSGTDFYADKGELRVSWDSYASTGNTYIPGNPYTWNGYLTGAYNIGQNQGYSINTDFLLTGETSFDKFKLEYLAGGTIYRNQTDNLLAWTVGGISVPAFFSLNASVEPAKVSSSTRGQQVNSVYGRLAMSYNKWAYFEVTGRNDWTSTLPTDTRSYFYPSMAMSIVLSEFLPESTKSWLDLLKVRDSWTMSKTPPGIYDATENDSFILNNATWNNQNGATAPSNLYGADILPESSTTFEIGLQAMMFKNRLMFDVSYYDKHMYDFLESASLTPASGFTGKYINTDEERSRRGWEVTLNGSVVKTHDWQWDLGANWSTYATYYTKLDPLYSDTAGKPWVKVGERVDAYASGDFLRDPSSGKIVFESGLVQYNPFATKFGNADPNYIWGLTSNLRYKDFSLFASVDGVVGGLMASQTEVYMWKNGVHPKTLTPERALDVANLGSENYLGQGVKIVSGTATYDPITNEILTDTRVFAPNDVKTTYSNYIQSLHSGNAWGGAGNSLDTHSKTFIKLREVALTYTVPAKYLNGWAKSASIGFIGQNLFLWAKEFEYSDPDGGNEDFADPSLRYLGGNIKLTF